MEITKPRTLELTILSAEDLRVDRKPATRDVFVVVQAESTHATAVSGDEYGGGFHSWNQKFSVNLNMNTKFITFEVNCKTRSGSVKDIGVVRIPVSDFLGGLVPDTFLRFLSYRLKDRYGNPNGIINFSVRAVSPGGKSGGGGSTAVDKVDGFSVPAAAADKIGGGSCGGSQVPAGGVVTGIPVSWNHAKNV
ncbi:BON1-associated protein 2-like [Lotus japonicus]|uniref:BON1-associated protein 2-like n=1 Tax=Lotus japonicus TaxID=34305 RepID=UPI002590FB1E|nr:BON1-associated protein 2-like [Lotus japonicus]